MMTPYRCHLCNIYIKYPLRGFILPGWDKGCGGLFGLPSSPYPVILGRLGGRRRRIGNSDASVHECIRSAVRPVIFVVSSFHSSVKKPTPHFWGVGFAGWLDNQKAFVLARKLVKSYRVEYRGYSGIQYHRSHTSVYHFYRSIAKLHLTDIFCRGMWQNFPVQQSYLYSDRECG